MSYKIVYTKDALKDMEKIQRSNLNKKVIKLIEIIKINPYQNPPEYEKLLGDLEGAYSRRINKKLPLYCFVYVNAKFSDQNSLRFFGKVRRNSTAL